MKNTLLILSILLSLNLKAQVPTFGLVAYYPFSGSANDLSGNNNNGAVYNAALTTDRFGNINSAYAFNGSSSYISVPASSYNSSFPNGQSISLWVKLDSFPSDGKEHYMVDKTNTGVFPYYQVFISNYGQANDIVYRYGQTSTITSQGNSIPFSDLPLHEWFNITFTTNSDTTRSYLNGALMDTFVSKSPIDSNSSPLLFGMSNYPNSVPFAGYLDDIRIYNRPLTNQEVLNLMDLSCYKQYSVADTLIISSITGLNSLPQSFGFVKIYPNPASGILNVAVSSPSSTYNISIVNSIGTSVYNNVLNTSTSQINLSNLGNTGLYLIQITDNSGNVLDTKKLILE